ncbi:Methyl farnesoate epoxidase [Blattella germanica]|nr:Methyl farnesoate epoxidase [Blattella germanica]
MFAISTLNVLWGMIAGTRYARDDAQLKPILQRLKKVFRSGNPSGGIIQAFPILKRIIPGLIGHTAQMQNLQEMQSMFRSSIKEHEKTIDRNNPRDLTDAYLREMNLQKLNPNTTFTETTTSSIEFSLMYMILYPEVQKAVQKELDAVVGQNRRPTLEDRPKYVVVN